MNPGTRLPLKICASEDSQCGRQASRYDIAACIDKKKGTDFVPFPDSLQRSLVQGGYNLDPVRVQIGGG